MLEQGNSDEHDFELMVSRSAQVGVEDEKKTRAEDNSANNVFDLSNESPASNLNEPPTSELILAQFIGLKKHVQRILPDDDLSATEMDDPIQAEFADVTGDAKIAKEKIDEKGEKISWQELELSFLIGEEDMPVVWPELDLNFSADEEDTVAVTDLSVADGEEDLFALELALMRSTPFTAQQDDLLVDIEEEQTEVFGLTSNEVVLPVYSVHHGPADDYAQSSAVAWEKNLAQAKDEQRLSAENTASFLSQSTMLSGFAISPRPEPRIIGLTQRSHIRLLGFFIAALLVIVLVASVLFAVGIHKNIVQNNVISTQRLNDISGQPVVTNAVKMIPTTAPTSTSTARVRTGPTAQSVASTVVFVKPTSVPAVIVPAATSVPTSSHVKATPVAPAPPAPTSLPAPPSQPTVSYEAESSANTGVGTNTYPCVYCSGGTRIGYVYLSNYLIFNNIDVNYSGNYTLTLYYINSVPGRTTEANLSVDGGSDAAIPGLQVLNDNNCCLYTQPQVTTTMIYLQKGNNTIKYSNATGNAPDIDRIVISQ